MSRSNCQSPYAPVLKAPNHYQNRIQFFTYWLLFSLTRGNAYALEERDSRGIVTALYLLDPTRVNRWSGQGRCRRAPAGSARRRQRGVGRVPAREIIHDVATRPITRCAACRGLRLRHATLQALAIQNNATKLFRSGRRRAAFSRARADRA